MALRPEADAGTEIGSTIELRPPSLPSELDSYFRFRWEQLRAPWGQPLGSERDEFDDGARHLMAWIASGEVVGVGRIHFPDPETAQIRFMATALAFRGRGIGTAIVRRLEQAAEEHGARSILLNAREPSVPFYAGLGYSICGGGPTLFGSIAHKRMTKLLP